MTYFLTTITLRLIKIYFRFTIGKPYWLVPFAIFLGFFYRRAAIAYLNTGRDIRRMESNTRSPIFANFNELLEGIVTVRAFSVEQRFLDSQYQKVDLATRVCQFKLNIPFIESEHTY